MVTCIGSLAAKSCELRQTWKGAAVAVDRVPGIGWCESPPEFNELSAGSLAAGSTTITLR